MHLRKCEHYDCIKSLCIQRLNTDLSMNKDYRTQKSPCASLPIHMEHAQDLKEADSSESKRKWCQENTVCRKSTFCTITSEQFITNISNT